MTQTLFVLLIAAMVATLCALAVGLFVMARGGPLNQKYGNKMMRLRVVLQGVALILFALVLLSKGA